MVGMSLAATHLGKNVTDFEHLQLGTSFAMFRLIDGVCDNDLVQSTGVDPVDGIAAQDAMGDEGIDFACAFLLEEFGGASDGVASVCKIINEDGDFA